MLTGPNLPAITSVCAAVKCSVIASGGVGSANDIAALRQLTQQCRNLTGVIVGKALYDGRVQLSLC